MNLYEIILRSSSVALKQQREDGSMPPGWNGPYNEKETPVRNTSHWLINFIKAYKISKEKKYRDAAKRCVSYLLSNDARPRGATFWHRDINRKDKCNGLIGQAWTMEALSIAGEELHLNECKKIAEEIFFLHPFDKKCGLWKRVDIDGKILDFDYVFNHQLWFAASASLIKNKEINEIINIFINKLNKNMRVSDDGLIYHFLSPDCNIKTRIYSVIIDLYLLKKGKKHHMLLREGYHSFNLYAFSLLRENFPSHSYWKADMFISSLNHIKLDSYRSYMENNKYGSPYNPVGFENAFSLYTFQDMFENADFLISDWVSWQIRKHFDFEASMMGKNTNDPITLSARLYEATRLPNVRINV